MSFWHAMQPFASNNSTAALRLYRTPANSVPTERSFSTQNLIQNKIRNRLDPTRVNKLTFSYINGRVLDRKVSQPKRWQDLTNDEELCLEDQLIAGYPSNENNTGSDRNSTTKPSIENQIPQGQYEADHSIHHYYSPDPDRNCALKRRENCEDFQNPSNCSSAKPIANFEISDSLQHLCKRPRLEESEEFLNAELKGSDPCYSSWSLEQEAEIWELE